MNDLQVFNNTEFGDLTVITIEGKQYFPASNCAKVLGYSNTIDAIRRHCRGVVKHDIPHPQSTTKTITRNFIPEGDLYRLIVNSKLPTAERFERWVFDEVLPSIRKHGAYMVPAKIEEVLTDPDTIIQLATALKNEQTKRRELEAANATLAVRASYTDKVLSSKDLFSITQIAKDYGMSGKQFNKLLHGLGVQYPQRGQWLLYAKYQDKGYTHSETVPFTHSDGTVGAAMNTKWTQAGRRFLYELLKKNGILLKIEQSATA